ncbi:hypothetical protein KUCAC02_007272 [Chaenocephalus aceratus]|uniref:Uncharacterized protein n=1 Tax=Chaenocephalus aceratus TaxID=36190 RepID=A0ACB9X4Z7_CHAAC|nr:hypothetical protein KUCAC02_007272 [Chaenocephalus aceratus]
MFKKKSKTTAITQLQTSAPSTELSALIDKLQKNADKVEKNSYDIELNLNKDVSKINEGKQPLYQDDTNKRILVSLDLLKGLDDDAVNAKRLQHPQAEMIEMDMRQLREKVIKLKEDHDRIYHLTRTEGLPSISWGNMMDEKLDNLNNKGFGQDLPSVENEVEEHNIFHSEVEALAPHNLLRRRQASRRSTPNYWPAPAAGSATCWACGTTCSAAHHELYWMDQQAEERVNYDWSDTNLDYPARQRQNFIGKCLESKEATITKLNDDGEKLIASDHPGKNVIEAHTEAVHADWKEYLNLLICEENHLKYMDEYHKYHKEARDTQDLLKRMDTELSQKYNPEFKDVYQMEGLIRELDDQAKAMDHFDDRVKALQKRGLQQVSPLKYRRETPPKMLPVEALCEFDTDDGAILRGERYTLLRNNGSKWDVKDAAGHQLTAPAVCFMVPPTDPEAVAVSDNLAGQQKSVKQRMSGSKTVLAKRFDELQKASGTGTTDKQEQQCRQLMAGMDKVTRPLQDSADRLQDMRDIAAAVGKIEPEKSSKVQESQSFLVSNPTCASASTSQQGGRSQQEVLQHRAAPAELSGETETFQPAGDFSSECKDSAVRELGDIASDLRTKRSVIAETEQTARWPKAAVTPWQLDSKSTAPTSRGRRRTSRSSTSGSTISIGRPTPGLRVCKEPRCLTAITAMIMTI